MASPFKLFGFGFKKNPKKNLPSPIPDKSEPEATTISAAGHFGHYVDIDGVNARSDRDLIERYRQLSEQPECDLAITEVTNEAISSSEVTAPVAINISDNNVSDKVKERIYTEFNKILSMLDFNASCTDIFRKWYVDGRLYYHVLIDPANPDKGIQELRQISPLKIRKIREVEYELDKDTGAHIEHLVSEYFVYSEDIISQHTHTIATGSFISGVKIAKDSIIFVPSGILNSTETKYISHLHKAIKPVNQLRMLEDALIIYRYSRAPERRIFYIDTGKMPRGKAEEYVRSVMANYRNKMVYNAEDGTTRDDRKHMCLSMDTLIPLLDGRTLSLKEISDEYNAGKKLWVYSCDPITGKFQPGPIDWAGVVKQNVSVMRLTLDNGKTITCTPEHRFPVWGKGLVRADELSVGNSMIPHYSKTDGNRPHMYLNDEKRWEYTDVLVSEWKKTNGITGEGHATVDISENIYVDADKSYLNHKITKIEYLEDKIDVGCITVDGHEQFHNYHTFALDAGIYSENSMLEDFWLPRTDGGKGTEITTLPGGEGMDQTDHLVFFKKRLFSALNVPLSRLDNTSTFSFGRVQETSREEVKFQRFIDGLRKKFSQLFLDALRTQLILKRVISESDWDYIKEKISIDYLKDNYFAELKEIELLKERVGTADAIQSMVGKYFSESYVRKNILRQSDEEIIQIDKEIQEEEAGKKTKKKEDKKAEAVPFNLAKDETERVEEVPVPEKEEPEEESQTEPEPESEIEEVPVEDTPEIEEVPLDPDEPVDDAQGIDNYKQPE